MSFADAVEGGEVVLLEHDENWAASSRFVNTPLESADVKAITAAALERIKAARLLLPEAEVLVERIVVGLLQGHVVLTGPPGTGKTTLATLIGEAFNCETTMVTATADWSAYDVIGGLQPKVVGGGDFASEVLVPWLGHVPRAALRCADAMAQHDHDEVGQPFQAHWLIIDEFSRAEIDKAIGPLYTALSGQPEIPLWFGDAPERQAITLPGRFRIVGTMNSVDTAYVFSFSQGLTRRFHFIHVGVPTEDQLEAELRVAAEQAVAWYRHVVATEATPTLSIEDAAAKLIDDDPTKDAVALLQAFVRFVRYGDEEARRPGWPIGTAQLVDVLKQLVLRHETESPGDATLAVDLALADRIVPQMGGLLNEQLDAAAQYLEVDLPALERTRLALRQVRDTQHTVF